MLPRPSGLFTCQVTDWGVIQNKSIEVIVKSPPQVSITPMAVTLEGGQSITLKCVENVFLKKVSFKYVWSKNGQLLKEFSVSKMPSITVSFGHSCYRLTVPSLPCFVG